MRKDWEEVQRKFFEAQKRVEELAEKDTKTVFEPEMEMLRKFCIKTKKGTPRWNRWGYLGVISWSEEMVDVNRLQLHHQYQQTMKN
jgi:hypothetical protein